MSNELITFDYQGQSVAFDPTARMWSLTEMHRAAGGEPNKAPAQWLRNQQTQELIAALEAEENYANLHNSGEERYANSHNAVETRRGANGGTWAHWQIAAAYSHYLDPRFYLQWNRWAMERVTGQGVDVARFTALEARITALEGKQTRQPRQTRQELPVPQGSTRGLQLPAIEVLEAIRAIGGYVQIADLRKALPHVEERALRQRLRRMRKRGLLIQPFYGRYALPKQK